MTKIIEVQVGNRVESFTNEQAATMYARKHGGKIINAGNAAIDKITSQSAMPVRSPGLCNLLGLSAAALNAPGELEACWSANGNKSAPQDRQKITAALVNFWRAKSGGTIDETVKFLQDRHPLLFPSSLAKTAPTANERLGANEILCVGPTVKYAFN